MLETKTFYRGNLPHFVPNDRPYFLTFRLAGCIPRDEEELSNLFQQRKFLEYDRALDLMTSGVHHLADSRVAKIVYDSILHRHNQTYDLHAFTIMSNHVHMVTTLCEGVLLPKMLKSLKSWTAHECNKILSRKGDFWMHEGYDHVIRDGKFGNAVFYVLNNPVKAGLVKHWREHPYTYLNPELPGFD